MQACTIQRNGQKKTDGQTEDGDVNPVSQSVHTGDTKMVHCI